MAKPVKVRTSSGEWADLAVQVPSANEPTFTGTTSSSQFSATNSVGDEGGEIKFAKAATNTTLNTGVTLDVYQDKVRLFETAGTNRGGYFDMTTLGAGVSTNLAPGLTHINTTAFSASSSVSINNCFSSTYQNYRIIFQISAVSTNNNVGFQLLSGSTALATGYYYVYAGYSDAGSASNTYGGNQSSVFMVDNNATYPNSLFSFDLSDPFTSSKAIVWSGTTAFVNSSSNNIIRVGGGNTSSTSSYDGIKFITNTGTMSGTVRVYGYRNS